MKGLTLNECLAGLTKQNLTHIRTHLGIQGVSNLKKQELIDVLVQKIPEKLPDVFRTMDSAQYDIVNQVAAQGGQAEITLEAEQLDYYVQRAILFPDNQNGKALLVMPKEVLECFNRMGTSQPQAEAEPTQHSEWASLTQGMLYYYGVLTFDDLIAGIEQHSEVKPDREQLLSDLRHAASSGAPIGLDTEKAWHAQVNDPEGVLREQQSRSHLTFCPFTKEELFVAAEPGFVDRTPIYRNFVNLIKTNYTIARDEADSLLEECVIAIRNGKTSGDLFKLLQSRMELDEVELIKAVMEQTIVLHNHTRQWILKGYSPNQLSDSRNRKGTRQPAAKSNVVNISSSKKKVGRNDPCPCGSGKKYKKCCGQ